MASWNSSKHSERFTFWWRNRILHIHKQPHDPYCFWVNTAQQLKQPNQIIRCLVHADRRVLICQKTFESVKSEKHSEETTE